ncbi:J domain-containing protein required for chloroplast accumulation response 1 [Linum grandiflorum]
MLRNFQRESVLLSPQRSPIVGSPAAKSPNSNSDIDFNDVFGGPPRRASLQNARHSFGEDPFGVDEDTTPRNRWSGLYEKPVFGEHEGGTHNRGRHQAGDFFDDIFGGNDSPRRIVSGSPSSSRVLSPARADPLPSSSPRNYLKAKEAGMMSNYSFSPLSRSSSKQDLVETQGDDELSKNMSKHHPPPNVTFQNMKGGDSRSCSQVGSNGHFHFSIYKWATQGAPPLSRTRSRDKFTSSSASEVSVEPEIAVEQHKQPDPQLKPRRSTHFHERGKKGGSITVEQLKQHDPKLKSVRVDSDSEPGTGERAREKELSEIKLKTPKKASALFNISQRKPDKAEKPAELEETQRKKSKAKGKVKDFVKIFNQDGKPDVKVQRPSKSGKKDRRNSRAMDDSKLGNEKTNLAPENKDTNLETEASYVQTEKQPAKERSSSYKPSEAGGTSVAPPEVSDASEATLGDQDEPFQVRELSQQTEDEKQLPTGDNTEQLLANDGKIRKWCQGKEGNIRSLLSTLQYILWAGSGWKPVALVDIIEGNAVKRTYQRALLCLHPDKLQQKGATGEQKFIAEKVFDILQEAWIHFNSLGSAV